MAQAFSKGDQVTLRLDDEFVSGEVITSAVSGLGETIHCVKTERGSISWVPTSQCLFAKNQAVVVKTDDVPYVFGRVTGHEIGASGFAEYRIALSQSQDYIPITFDLDAVFRTDEAKK
jgi:hypothetical protein